MKKPNTGYANREIVLFLKNMKAAREMVYANRNQASKNQFMFLFNKARSDVRRMIRYRNMGLI